MQPRNHSTAARRWAKFPATILFATGLVWLLQKYFTLNWDLLGENTETGIGAVWAFTDMVVIPLGSLAIGVCVLFLQRWSLWAACFFPLLPLGSVFVHLIQRINMKFSEYHASQEVAKFGGGVMTALELLAILVLYGLVVYHLRKALYWQSQARQWAGGPAAAKHDAAREPSQSAALQASEEDEEVCLLMPDFDDDKLNT